jgi:predicted phosphodiesterase
MKIKVVSDLHLEFSDVNIPNNGCDVLILSGDILLASPLHDFSADIPDTDIKSHRHAQAIRFRNFLRYCSEDFPNVIYIAGNHEFYHGKFYQSLDILREECAQFANVHFLEDKSVTIDDTIFVGGTLWTDMCDLDPMTMLFSEQRMNDYNLIKNDHNGYRAISAKDTAMRHRKTLEHIRVVVDNAPYDMKIVVVGHHAPSFQSVDKRYKGNSINGAYASDLTNFILDRPRINVWTHGHMHSRNDYMIGPTRIVCNPRGYCQNGYGEDTGWDVNLIVEI